MRVFTRPELSILIHLLLLLKYNTVNKIIKYTGGILSRGILSWGDFVLGGILSRGILSGGFCPGGFCPGGFCPDTNSSGSARGGEGCWCLELTDALGQQ